MNRVRPLRWGLGNEGVSCVKSSELGFWGGRWGCGAVCALFFSRPGVRGRSRADRVGLRKADASRLRTGQRSCHLELLEPVIRLTKDSRMHLNFCHPCQTQLGYVWFRAMG